MASRKQPSMFLLLTISFLINSSKAADCDHGAVAVYWGQLGGDEGEGTLQEACAAGNYNIVVIDTLFLYDSGNTPDIILPGHCGNSTYPCTKLRSQIEYCQGKGIKVFLSLVIRPTLASESDGYPLESSENVAEKYADYLLNNFLSGKPGPLGKVTLDGFDLPSVVDGFKLHVDALVKAIHASTKNRKRKTYLSAGPSCNYPDNILNSAIQTGVFDYIWVAFHRDPSCRYSDGSAKRLLKAWRTWTSELPNSLIFLQLTANSEDDSYIAPEKLNSEVLSITKADSNYGGVMVWNRYYDRISKYSRKIKDSIKNHCECVCTDDDESASTSFFGLESRSSRME